MRLAAQIWLVGTIRKAGDDGISFAEINETWLETAMMKASSTTATANKSHQDLKEE